MLSEEDDTERAFAQLSDDLVLVKTRLLREALGAQDLVVPQLQRVCITEVNRPLLRGRALQDQTVAYTGLGGTAFLLDSLPRVDQALERAQIVLDVLLLGALGAAEHDGALAYVQLVLLELV